MLGKQIDDTLSTLKFLDENEVKHLAKQVMNILIDEPNVLHITGNTIVCGNIYGQFTDLKNALKKGTLGVDNYLFLGDFINRGENSTETIQLLYLYKTKYPKSFYFLKGHQEHQEHQEQFMGTGFKNEIYKKYGNLNAYNCYLTTLKYLPLAAVINSQYFCVHAGLSPKINFVDQINVIKRTQCTQEPSPLNDLLYSCPDDIDGWDVDSGRIGNYKYGKNVVADFLYINKMTALIRSHRLSEEGCDTQFQGQLINIFSATNFGLRCGNKGAVVKIKGDKWKICQLPYYTGEYDNLLNKVPYFM